jgi:flavin reductase (DIM6/NTAB) family NADH-FMN oxidoreductase RutF
MGHFATGVTVVTSRGYEGAPIGVTVNAFCSLSLEPILVLVCLHGRASSHDPLLARGCFAVNILARGDVDLARRFAAGQERDRFRDVPWKAAANGSPLLEGCLGWLECRVWQVFPGGDHSVIVGEVVGCGASEGDPLLFFRGELGGLRP